MLVIQWRLDWLPDTGQWEDVISIPVGTGSSEIGIDMPVFGQADRLIGDPNFGATCAVGCRFYFTCYRDEDTNDITMTNLRMSDWYFQYTRITDLGRRVVPGDYEYWAVHDGTADSIYRYQGPSEVVETFRIPFTYSMSPLHNFVAPASKTSNEVYYGRCYNYVQGNDLRVYMRIRNAYPASYRPGACVHDGIWRTHDRTGGMCHILTDGAWKEMRTLPDKGIEDPPSILRNDNWVSQMLVGNY